jgi:Stage II sporulation protein E (SpoIIE)
MEDTMLSTPDRPLPNVSPAEEPKKLYRLIEPAFEDLPADHAAEFFRSALERVRERFGEECGIEDAVLAHREVHGWRVTAGQAALLERLDLLPAAERDAFFSQQIAIAPAPRPAVLWLIGARAEWLAIFGLSEPPDEGRALLFQMARLAIQHRALESGWTGLLERARAIQRNLLPDPLPELRGFELAARSESADVVGGDVFDAIELSPSTLGLMLGDASGHGLPAALEARDVVVGLRMGVAQHLKIDATIERLNRILCASTLSSRFVSLVYGELDDAGTFDYVNAGHPAPLLLTRRGPAHGLPHSGRVLGVSPGSTYRVARAEIPLEGLLLLYSDGVTECPSPEGEEFGVTRLAGLAQALCTAPATHLVSAIFEALGEHAGRERLPDDASVLVVKRK